MQSSQMLMLFGSLNIFPALDSGLRQTKQICS